MVGNGEEAQGRVWHSSMQIAPLIMTHCSRAAVLNNAHLSRAAVLNNAHLRDAAAPSSVCPQDDSTHMIPDQSGLEVDSQELQPL